MDYTEIQKEFNTVIKNSQGNIEDPQTNDLFKDWLQAKSKFIHAFGEALTYTFPSKVSFEMSKKDQNRMIEDFIADLEGFLKYSDLIDFLYKFKSDFFSNSISENYKYNDEIIPAGTKLIKSFKYFIKDPYDLSFWQDKASRIIQMNKVSGLLTISVHPLDFLSLSENNHKWRSCHALDGEYRAGNLSYMTDTTTAICYLWNGQEEKLEYFSKPWNSKKWRMLLYVSENWDMVFAGRQYPFSSTTALEFIRTNLFPAIGLGQFSAFSDKDVDAIGELRLRKKYIPTGTGELAPLMEIVDDYHSEYCEPLHFNDVLRSSSYKPQYSFKEYLSFNNVPRISLDAIPHFQVGSFVSCLKCNCNEITNSEYMVCDNCIDDSERYHCACCNASTLCFEDFIYLEYYDEYVCKDCFETEVIRCDNCDEYFYLTDCSYIEDDDIYLCSICKEENELWLEEQKLNRR